MKYIVQENQGSRRGFLNSLVIELKRLNPERKFVVEKEQIYVDTRKLWELKLPDTVYALFGPGRKKIEKYKFLPVKNKNYYAFLFTIRV